MSYHPRDGKLPELGRRIVVQHYHFPPEGISGIVEGIQEGERMKIWLREEGDQLNMYDLLSVSWEYSDDT